MQPSSDYSDFITLISNYHTGITCDGTKPAGQCVLNVAVEDILMSIQPFMSLELGKSCFVLFLNNYYFAVSKSTPVIFYPFLLPNVGNIAFYISIFTESYFSH